MTPDPRTAAATRRRECMIADDARIDERYRVEKVKTRVRRERLASAERRLIVARDALATVRAQLERGERVEDVLQVVEAGIAATAEEPS